MILKESQHTYRKWACRIVISCQTRKREEEEEGADSSVAHSTSSLVLVKSFIIWSLYALF